MQKQLRLAELEPGRTRGPQETAFTLGFVSYPCFSDSAAGPVKGFCGLAPEKMVTATQGEEPVGVLGAEGGGGCVGWAGVTRRQAQTEAHSGGEPSLSRLDYWQEVATGLKSQVVPNWAAGCIIEWAPSGSDGKVSALQWETRSVITGLGRS